LKWAPRIEVGAAGFDGKVYYVTTGTGEGNVRPSHTACASTSQQLGVKEMTPNVGAEKVVGGPLPVGVGGGYRQGTPKAADGIEPWGRVPTWRNQNISNDIG